jgi:GntR family transcriptional regulator/MocR family aminotransferase
MDLALDKQGALYGQIARALKRAILDGRLVAGSRLPSTRALAGALGVSRKSVVDAYELLCVEQLAVARGGSGTRVAKVGAVVPKTFVTLRPTSQYVARMRTLEPVTTGSHSGLRYDLHTGEPLLNAALFNSWRRKLAAAALRAGPKYPAPEGFPPLRRALADYLGRRRGIICDAADILIVGGTQQALTLTARVLVDSRDSVVIEDPHYQMAFQGLVAHGARLISVRTDDEGLVVRELPEELVRMAYVTPSHQFPSGTTMSLARRMELLHWASRNECWIFEDDYGAEFHSGTRTVAPLRSLDIADRVIYVGTFSKSLFPSLRLGYIVCPKALRHDLFKAKLLDDLGSPTIEQAALATYIESRLYEKHLRISVKELISRRCTAIDTLQRLAGPHIDIGPRAGGTHFIIWLRDVSFDQLMPLVEHAASVGLALHPIHPYYRTRPDRPGLLIDYAALSRGQLTCAIELFAQCLKAVGCPVTVVSKNSEKVDVDGAKQRTYAASAFGDAVLLRDA